MRTSTRASLLALLVLAPACTVQETPIPSLAGPSELALRIALQITPDQILQDGTSQATLSIEAANFDGRPARGLSLRIQTVFEGIIQDFGILSAKTVVTGDDGRARVVYTAPARPSQPVDQFNVVTFEVTPIGTDYNGAEERRVQLRLLPPGVVQPPRPPNQTPVPEFTFAPSNPAVLTNVVFDASATQDEGVACGTSCSYTWDFGDGESGAGIFASHVYRTPGTFLVRLTVRDAQGASALTAQPITVGGGTAPTAVFTFSPSAPVIGEQIFFTAEGSRAATGRSIVSYEWNFGSGRTGTGVTISKGYDTPGTYTVTLTVTDDAGQRGTTQQSVTVSGGSTPTASFTYSPSAPAVGQTISFTAEASRAAVGRRIVSYEWNFGSGRVGSGVVITQRYDVAGTFNVTLTVTDDLGNRATTTQPVTISQSGSLQAVLRVSPTTGGVPGTLFQFDGAESTRGASPIVEYRFNFGDNTDDVVGPSPVATHQFASPGSYLVSLQVRDSAGRTSIARVTVAVGAPGTGGGTGSLQARLTVSPTSGQVNVTDFVFDAGGSTAGSSPIVSYTFTFPDGSSQGPGAQATATKRLSATGAQTVTVLVRASDNSAHAANVTVQVNP